MKNNIKHRKEKLLETIKLPSHFQVDEEVSLQFNKDVIKNCLISAVHFKNEGKVRYDIKIIVGENNGEYITTTIKDVDSVWVIKKVK